MFTLGFILGTALGIACLIGVLLIGVWHLFKPDNTNKTGGN